MSTETLVNIDTLRINGERLWASLMELAQIGATKKGGVCRLTLTDLDKHGRDLVIRWAKEAGMSVTIDKIGNGFMRRPGRNNALPAEQAHPGHVGADRRQLDAVVDLLRGLRRFREHRGARWAGRQLPVDLPVRVRM